MVESRWVLGSNEFMSGLAIINQNFVVVDAGLDFDLVTDLVIKTLV